MKNFVKKLDFSGEISSIFLALIIMCLYFSFMSPYFFTVKNILNVTMNCSILGIMAAGLFISMVIGEIDVSQYSILALSTAVMAILIQSDMGVGLAITISMGVALICGAINGASVAFLRINPIITTLGTMLIYRALAYKITEAKAMGIEGDFFFSNWRKIPQYSSKCLYYAGCLFDGIRGIEIHSLRQKGLRSWRKSSSKLYFGN